MQHALRIEGVVLERLDGLRVEGRAARRGPERAVSVWRPARPAICEFGRIDAEAEAVELLVEREGHDRRRG